MILSQDYKMIQFYSGDILKDEIEMDFSTAFVVEDV
jgi:hypothetical protein